MKRVTIILILLLIALPVYAQENTQKKSPEVQTLFGGDDYHSGGYGGPEVKFTQINKEWGVAVGGRGGWVINHVFTIGGGGYGIVTSHKIKELSVPDTNQYLSVGWGGLFLEYTNSHYKPMHFTVHALIGGGGATYTPHSSEFMTDSRSKGYENSPFFVFEPGLGIELNLLKFMRVELGASYRIISGLDMSHTNNQDLSGLSANLTFKFGSF